MAWRRYEKMTIAVEVSHILLSLEYYRLARSCLL